MKSGGGAKARGVEQALDHIWPDKIPEGLSAKERNVPHKEQSDNEVGYRRPPVAHQFKKGQSGNPKGRRKGSVSAVSKSMNETIQPSVDGISAREIIMQRLAQIRARMDAADSREN
jgi:hypothetical protein